MFPSEYVTRPAVYSRVTCAREKLVARFFFPHRNFQTCGVASVMPVSLEIDFFAETSVSFKKDKSHFGLFRVIYQRTRIR